MKDDNFSQIHNIQRAFLNAHLKKSQKKIIGLKVPLLEFFYADRVFPFFPKSKFIHIIRDPRDVLDSSSNYQNWHFEVGDFTKKWNDSVRLTTINSDLNPNNYMVVKYEDIVKNRREAFQDICEFIEVSFEEQMLEMKNHPNWKVRKNSSFEGADLPKQNRYLELQQPEDTLIVEFFCRKGMYQNGYNSAHKTLFWKSRKFKLFSNIFKIYLKRVTHKIAFLIPKIIKESQTYLSLKEKIFKRVEVQKSKKWE